MSRNNVFSDGTSNYRYPHKLPDFLYHGTLRSNVERILSRGLEPRWDRPATDNLTSPSVRDYLYLGTINRCANHICRVVEWNLVPKRGIKDNVVILRVDTSLLNKRLLRPDEDWCTSLWDAEVPDYLEDSNTWTFEGRVYPNEDEAVLAATGGLVEWARRCWYDSLAEEESVAYKGVIPPEAITVVASDEWDGGLRNLRARWAVEYSGMTTNREPAEGAVQQETDLEAT
jgi:hypothetical protein